jgi:hypothetical protein
MVLMPASCQLVTPKYAWIVVAVVAISWYRHSFSADVQPATWRPAQLSQAHCGVSCDPVRTAFERLSEHEVKAFYLRCSHEVAERTLAGGEVMICSISYDVLLKKHFYGNFDSLLSWSRAQHGASRPLPMGSRRPAEVPRRLHTMQ